MINVSEDILLVKTLKTLIPFVEFVVLKNYSHSSLIENFAIKNNLKIFKDEDFDYTNFSFVLHLNSGEEVKNIYILLPFLQNYEKTCSFYCKTISKNNGIDTFSCVDRIKSTDMMCNKKSIDLLGTAFYIIVSEINENFVNSLEKEFGKNSYSLFCKAKLFDTKKEYENLLICANELCSLQTKEYNDYLFYGFLFKGIALFNLKHKYYETWLIKAYQYSLQHVPRCEPYVYLTMFEVQNKNIEKAYEWIETACRIARPVEGDPKIYIDYTVYDFNRWNLKIHLSTLVFRQSLAVELNDKILKTRQSLNRLNIKTNE